MESWVFVDICHISLIEIKSNNLCLAWDGVYGALKQFVQDSLKLEGTWSQPGGDKKVFKTDKCLISWRKNRKLLYIEGEKETQVKIELYKCLFDEEFQPSFQASLPCNSYDTSAEIEELKSGQLTNGQAIQSLAESVSQMASIISQLQDRTKIFEEHFPEVNKVNQTNFTTPSVKKIIQAVNCESPDNNLCTSPAQDLVNENMNIISSANDQLGDRTRLNRSQ